MPLEDLTGGSKYIDDFDATNPLNTDVESEGAGHLRGIKNVLKNLNTALHVIAGRIDMFCSADLFAGETGNRVNLAGFLFHKAAAAGYLASLWNTLGSAGTYSMLSFTVAGGSTVGSISSTVSGTSFNTTSDERIKDKVDGPTDYLAMVRAVQPFWYKFNKSFTQQTDEEYEAQAPTLGLSAQAAREVLPFTVTETPHKLEAFPDDYGMLVGDWSRAVPALFGAIAQLEAQVDDLRTQLAAK